MKWIQLHKQGNSIALFDKNNNRTIDVILNSYLIKALPYGNDLILNGYVITDKKNKFKHEKTLICFVKCIYINCVNITDSILQKKLLRENVREIKNKILVL